VCRGIAWLELAAQALPEGRNREWVHGKVPPFDKLSSSLSDLGVEDRVVSKAEPPRAGLVYGSQFMVHGIKRKSPIQRKER